MFRAAWNQAHRCGQCTRWPREKQKNVGNFRPVFLTQAAQPDRRNRITAAACPTVAERRPWTASAAVAPPASRAETARSASSVKPRGLVSTAKPCQRRGQLLAEPFPVRITLQIARGHQRQISHPRGRFEMKLHRQLRQLHGVAGQNRVAIQPSHDLFQHGPQLLPRGIENHQSRPRRQRVEHDAQDVERQKQ